MINVLSKIIGVNNLLVLGINRTNENDFYYCLYVKKNKSKLEITETRQYNSFENLTASLNLNIPIIVVIDGKGVLNKKIDLSNENDISWKKNLDFTSLYFTSFNSEDFEFYSFGRKEWIDQVIDNLKQSKLKIIDFYLGSLTAALLHPVLKNDILYTKEYQLEFAENKLMSFKRSMQSDTEELYMFDETQFSSDYLSLYGAAVDFYLKQKQVQKNKPEKLDKEEFIYQKSFNLIGVMILILFFCSLFASYLFIQHYSKENVKLNQENIFSNQTYQQIIKLEEKKEEKLKILNETRQLSKKFLSFYAYETVKSVPDEIELSAVNIFPVDNDVKNGKKIAVNSNYILLKGTTRSETSFNKWIETLQKLSCIKTFEILSIKKDRKGVQHFEIKAIPNDV